MSDRGAVTLREFYFDATSVFSYRIVRFARPTDEIKVKHISGNYFANTPDEVAV